MKPSPILYEWFAAREPLCRLVIPPTYLDAFQHLNTRYYLHIFDDAAETMVMEFGLTLEFHREHQTGGFDLEHHLHYLREIRAGDNISIYSRLVGCSSKRIHYLLFMLNDTQRVVAATFECVNSFADLSIRKTAAFPSEIYAHIQERLRQDQALAWPPPICGIMTA